MNREQAKATIRSRVVINAQHIKSLHSVDEVIDQLCDDYEQRLSEGIELLINDHAAMMREKELKIEWLQECIDKRNELDKKYGEQL